MTPSADINGIKLPLTSSVDLSYISDVSVNENF